ncbi:MAG: hypothetical protein QF463_04150 [Vicinamibacterales bacterium]|jgi:hypothetical protein|nr:hypothetical protein [Acidobacteriota bacterium]MDP6374146.1 hypothetical protein [Vicinamibacterales bacterium]MDP6608236.1 hypothetical protein [Vicinamibacterales bacterium]HAK56985.1 hypothetical protein [Acidobacteriota bacterium]|tara:strand:+ start:5730 stop:6752 length:1023 start_codon:yes stop_codon:yes gene_type:complete
MPITVAFRDGARRVQSAPAILAGVFALTLLLALPLGLALRNSIRAHLGDSVAADTVASGVNADWWDEFLSQADGIGQTFSPSVIGFAAVLDNLSAVLDNRPRAAILVSAAAAYLFGWAFLVGGILDRYARNRPIRGPAFFAACGTFFFRFLRLGVISWLVYGALFGTVHRWLFDEFYVWLIRDLTVERTGFFLRVLLYAAFGTVVLFCNVVLDYAKIRAVVEDRRSMIGATVAGVRFVWRHLAATSRLYLLNSAVFVAIVTVYAAVAPGAGGTGAEMWFAFLIGQAYVLARLWVKLLFLGTQTALFQGELAHAGYTAAPSFTPPEPPAAEAIAGAPTGGV